MKDKKEKYEKWILIVIGLAILIVAFSMFVNSTKSIAPLNGLMTPPQIILTQSIINTYASTSTPLLNQNGQTFSIAGEQPTNISYVGTPLTASFSIPITNLTSTTSTTAISTDCEPFVYDNTSQTVVSQGTAVSVLSSPYTSSISYTPTSSAVYIFGAICQTSKATYDITTNSWSAWSTPIVANQQQLFAVKIETTATPPPPPQFSLSGLLSSIIALISNFLHSIGL